MCVELTIEFGQIITFLQMREKWPSTTKWFSVSQQHSKYVFFLSSLSFIKTIHEQMNASGHVIHSLETYQFFQAIPTTQLYSQVSPIRPLTSKRNSKYVFIMKPNYTHNTSLVDLNRGPVLISSGRNTVPVQRNKDLWYGYI